MDFLSLGVLGLLALFFLFMAARYAAEQRRHGRMTAPPPQKTIYPSTDDRDREDRDRAA
jgi:hypothetical protein